MIDNIALGVLLALSLLVAAVSFTGTRQPVGAAQSIAASGD